MRLRRNGVLALVLGAAVVAGSGGVLAQDDSHLTAPCRDAWELSAAYGTCGARSDAPGNKFETIDPREQRCVITTSCEYTRTVDGTAQLNRRETSWEGKWTLVHHLRNCDGHLRRTC